MKQRARCCWLLTAALLMDFSAYAQPAPVARFALVIGNNRPHSDDGETLHYADDDALATHELLLEAGVASIALVRMDTETRALHPNWHAFGTPSKRDLERATQQLQSQLKTVEAQGRRSELYFVYSGHGDVENGEGVLALEDGRITRSALYELLTSLAATHSHVIIDACKSYFMAYERGPGGKHVRFAGAVTAALPATLKQVGFVLSTASDRESHEWERYRGGILSHELQSALRGAADVNLDNQIDYRELGAFLQATNAGVENPRYRPDFLVRAPNNDFGSTVFAWRKDHRALAINAHSWDHFYIENARGDRVLDAHPEAGQALQLHVPGELPLFVHRQDGKGERVITRPESQLDEPIPSHPEVAVRDGAAGRAYQRLFATPFGARGLQTFRTTRRPHVEFTDIGPSPQPQALRLGTGILTLTAAAAGLVLNAVALGKYVAASDASQRETDRANHAIATLNRVSIACYSGAILAGAAWAWGPWWQSDAIRVSAAARLEGSRRGALTVELHGKF